MSNPFKLCAHLARRGQPTGLFYALATGCTCADSRANCVHPATSALAYAVARGDSIATCSHCAITLWPRATGLFSASFHPGSRIKGFAFGDFARASSGVPPCRRPKYYIRRPPSIVSSHAATEPCSWTTLALTHICTHGTSTPASA